MTQVGFTGFRCFIYSLMCIIVVSGNASAQELTRTQCKQWDDAYLSVINLFALLGAILPLLFNLTIPPTLGRFFWLLTASRLRIFIGSLIVFLVLAGVSIVFPFLVGFGWFVFSGIDPSYFNCATLRFGATGLLFGLVGEGTAAVALWLAVLILLLVACLLGAFITLFISRLLRGRIGIHSLVRGGNK